MNANQETLDSLAVSRAAEWFVAHRAGGLTESQCEAFIDWLRASPAHTREYLALTGFTADFARAMEAFTVPAEELIARARADRTVLSPAFVPQAPVRTRRNFTIGALATAAALLISVLTGWAWNHPDYSTAHTEQRSWRLPDGSTVHLNSSSRIELSFNAARREIDLIEGQAIFQVAKDASRPFVVHAGDTQVQAVGTQFDVYRKAGETLVSVLEGRVAVTHAAAGQNIELDAGQQISIGPGETKVSRQESSVRKTVAWLQRQVIFDRDPLGEVVEEFNRYNEVRIRVEDPALRREEVSGIFNAYDTESFIQFLERQPGMHVEQRAREVRVTPNHLPLTK